MTPKISGTCCVEVTSSQMSRFVSGNEQQGLQIPEILEVHHLMKRALGNILYTLRTINIVMSTGESRVYVRFSKNIKIKRKQSFHVLGKRI